MQAIKTMNNGYIKFYRSSLNHWLYQEKREHTKREAWEDLLLLCNHSDTKILIGNELIECKRGQSVNSLRSWAKQFNWSIQQVRSFFKLLTNDNMLITEGLKKATRITICNYDIYQDEQHANNTQITREQHASNTQATTNNNVKNEKNEKNNNTPIVPKKEFDLSFVSDEILPLVEEFIRYRKHDLKKQFKTERGISLFYKTLMKLSNGNPEKAKKLVDYAKDHEWQTVYAIENQHQSPSQPATYKELKFQRENRIRDIKNLKSI